MTAPLMPSSFSPTPPKVGAYWFWWALLLIVLAGLYCVRSILFPFVVGIAFAYALNPLVNALTRIYIPRLLATFAVLFLFFAAIVGLFFLVVPIVETELVSLLPRLPYYFTILYQEALGLMDRVAAHLSADDWLRVKGAAASTFQTLLQWGTHLVGSILTSGLALANLLGLVIITPFVAFYFLYSWPVFLDKAATWIPPVYRAEVLQMAEDCDAALAGFARGQALVCILLAIFYSIGLWSIGLEFGFALGLLAGLCAFVPYIGVGTWFLVALLLAFVQFTTWEPIGLMISLFAFGQFVEANFLSPKLVGGRVGLHPLIIIFALLAGGSLWGFFGVVAAVPVAAVVGVFVRHGLAWYLRSSYYQQTIVAAKNMPKKEGRSKKSALIVSSNGEPS